jgi:hypothetical protein
MIAQALKLEIEAYANRTLSSNRLFGMARAGSVSHKALLAYLFNVRYLIQHTPPCLERARARSAARGWNALAAYYAGKAEDEYGHDRWADNDVASVRENLGLEPPTRPARAMVELVTFLGDLIDVHPQRYLAYILFAEYFTVLAGPAWLAALERNCGIPSEWLTSISKHAELDRLHVSEAGREIDVLLPDPLELPGLTETLRRSMDYFDRFCDELGRVEG